MIRNRELQIALVLMLFTCIGVFRGRHVVGEDLSSSYVGCRVLAAGGGAHLYSHDPEIFRTVEDPVWTSIARQAGFSPLGLLHPYVQTPLWAYVLRPVCAHTNFRRFCQLFLVLIMLATSGVIWLVSRYWTPSLFHPAWTALIYAALMLSEPFKYAVFLTQTHILFVFLTVLALVLAERDREMPAGICLALAARPLKSRPASS
ncbi:MAG TPA: glycosyltransferase family 87 protein [Acidisarcina sp.]